MFENAGKKIKAVAKGYFILQCVVAFFTGIMLFAADEDMVGVMLLIWILIPLVAWLSSLMLYGFGEIVDAAVINRKITAGGPVNAPAAKPVDQVKVQPAKTPAPSVETPKPKQPERDVTPYLGKKYCGGCGTILSPDTTVCDCGCKYLGVINKTNAQSVLSNVLEDDQ